MKDNSGIKGLAGKTSQEMHTCMRYMLSFQNIHQLYLFFSPPPRYAHFIHTTGSVFPYWCFSSCSNSLHLQSPWRSKTVFSDIEHNVWDSPPAAGLQVCQQARVFYEGERRRKNRIAQLFPAPLFGCVCKWFGCNGTAQMEPKWHASDCTAVWRCVACFVHLTQKGKIKITAFNITSQRFDFMLQRCWYFICSSFLKYCMELNTNNASVVPPHTEEYQLAIPIQGYYRMWRSRFSSVKN